MGNLLEEPFPRPDDLLKVPSYKHAIPVAPPQLALAMEPQQLDEAIALETDALAAKNILFHPAEPIQ